MPEGLGTYGSDETWLAFACSEISFGCKAAAKAV